jgi:hypothetical protein
LFVWLVFKSYFPSWWSLLMYTIIST